MTKTGRTVTAGFFVQSPRVSNHSYFNAFTGIIVAARNAG